MEKRYNQFREELLSSCVPFWLDNAVDKEFGGITYFKDILGLPVEAYEHDMKLWWQHNETVIASLMFYKHTGEQKYKDIFDKVCDYAFTHF